MNLTIYVKSYQTIFSDGIHRHGFLNHESAVKIPPQQMPKNSSLGIIYSPNFLNTGWAPGPTVIVKGCYNPYKWPKINGFAWCYFTWNMSFHHTYNWFLGPPCVQTGHRLPTPSDTKAVPMASSMSTASLEREM